MKKIIALFVCISLFASCIICSDFVGWYGENTNHPKFNNDSIAVRVDFERNSKEIGIIPAIWIKKLPGYKICFSVRDTYNYYLNVDSIAFNIYSATSKSILQSTLVDSSGFSPQTVSSIDKVEFRGITEMDKVYLIDSPKNHKEDLLIDFTLYLQTKNKEQRIITYSRYELVYKRLKVGIIPFWHFSDFK